MPKTNTTLMKTQEDLCPVAGAFLLSNAPKRHSMLKTPCRNDILIAHTDS